MNPYKNEWRRTNPDLRVYVPEEANGFDAVNQHFLVTRSPRGCWLAFWTSAADEGEMNQSVLISRSSDRGVHWSEPAVIDGPWMRNRDFKAPRQIDGAWIASSSVVNEEAGKKFAGIASWGFPVVVPDLNRVYCFYFRCPGKADLGYAAGGVLTGRYSEDDGETWSESFEVPVRRTAGDHPDVSVPPNMIIWQTPTTISNGDVIAPFTSWTSAESVVGPGSESYFLRFDNILTERNAARLTTTTLPEGNRGLRFPSCQNLSFSFCEEPATVELSDGRLFCVMRTDSGYIVFTISGDQGLTWSAPAPLYRDGEHELMLNPVTPCPLWKLQDGRYLLLFCNNKGDANGGYFPCGFDCVRMNRYPAFLSVGREDLQNTRCPLRFGPPKMILDTQGKSMGPGGRTEVGSYSSLLEDGDDRILFYPDRKHFLLGKRLTDDWLAGCES
jgi:hypothetical protein